MNDHGKLRVFPIALAVAAVIAALTGCAGREKVLDVSKTLQRQGPLYADAVASLNERDKALSASICDKLYLEGIAQVNAREGAIAKDIAKESVSVLAGVEDSVEKAAREKGIEETRDRLEAEQKAAEASGNPLKLLAADTRSVQFELEVAAVTGRAYETAVKNVDTSTDVLVKDLSNRAEEAREKYKKALVDCKKKIEGDPTAGAVDYSSFYEELETFLRDVGKAGEMIELYLEANAVSGRGSYLDAFLEGAGEGFTKRVKGGDSKGAEGASADLPSDADSLGEQLRAAFNEVDLDALFDGFGSDDIKSRLYQAARNVIENLSKDEIKKAEDKAGDEVRATAETAIEVQP